MDDLYGFSEGVGYFFPWWDKESDLLLRRS